MIQEQPGEPRFGFDVGTPLNEGTHLKVSFGAPAGSTTAPNLQWGQNGAHMAAMLRQQPVRIAIHASQFLKKKLIGVARNVCRRSALRLPDRNAAAGDRAPPPLPEMLVELCKADRPLALFPVRLETRFFPQPNGGSELRVRVYPDRIHIDSHEAELTQAEKTWGQHYWTQIWRAGDDTQAQKNAWRQLADRYDPQRAAWIARLLRPTNLESRTASTRTELPARRCRGGGQGRGVAQRAEGAAAADRWIAIVQAAGRVIAAAAGRDIRPDLAVGPDPQVDADTAPEIPGDQAAVDAGMRWMVDFDEAEAAGMGLRIPLTRRESRRGHRKPDRARGGRGRDGE